MPTFPTYRGELPECLNPLNPRHYFLLIYWIVFRPTALICYLYEADSKLYQSKGMPNFFRIWHTRPYRNLYIMMPGTSILMSVIIGIIYMTMDTFAFELPPIQFIKGIIGLILGVNVGLFIGFVLGAAIGMIFGTAGFVGFSLSCGIMTGITIGIPSMTVGSYALRVSFDITAGLKFGLALGVVTIIITSIAFKEMFEKPSGALETIKSIALGTIVGMFLTIAVILVFGISFHIPHTPRTLPFIADALRTGTIASMLIGITAGVLGSIVGNLGGGVLSGIGFSLATGLLFNITKAIWMGLGSLRILFFPIQLIFVLNILKKIKHPLEWDSLLVVPLPNTNLMLTQHLKKDEKYALCLLTELGRNSFQRWAIQKALYNHIHTHSNPIKFLYKLFANPNLGEYVLPPMRENDKEQNIPVYHLFIGEIALKFVKTTWDINFIFVDRLVWWLTYPLREHRHTSLTRFAGILYELLDSKTLEPESFSAYTEICNNLSTYPDSQEIVQTFNIMLSFLSYQNLSDLLEASEFTWHLNFEDPIRPPILSTLKRLGDVGKEIQTYHDSTSRMNQMAALGRATDMLKKLETYVQEQVITPEQYLLQQIIHQWQDVLIPASGELGRAEEAGPVANPYIAGNPVTGELFVGREDILRRLEELWSGAGQKPSVVLYGHRRMGKSSILHNLGTRFGQNTEIIDFNMQRAGLVASTGELLYNLALAIYDALPTPTPFQEGNRSFSEPEEERFLEHNPYTAFDRFLKQVDRIRGAKRFIITIDEFEMIEQRIQRGNVEPLLLDFWRGVIQTYPWVIMAFAGLHTLQEMTQDYWNPLFGSVTGIPVSFLKENAARRLITQPSADFALDYDQDAISEIIRFTYGQPYLVQLICHCLVSLFNRQTFEEGIERERRFHRSDVEAVINAPEFFRDGDAYFSGVWQQAQHDDTPEAYAMLKVLAQAEAGLSIAELVEQSGLALEQAQAGLKFLQRHDMVRETAGHWTFTVELMRRWVLHRK